MNNMDIELYGVLTVQDIEQVLPALPFLRVLSYLDAKTLGRCILVNKAWRAACEASELWDKFCKELWHDKAWVPEALLTMDDKREAYACSLKEGCRNDITEEELCKFTWNFVFRNTILTYRALPPIRRYFHLEGHKLTAPKDDPLEMASGSREHTWTLLKPGNMLCVQTPLNRYPYLRISRTQDWGWCMENNWVYFLSDHKAGSNPGLGKEGDTEELSQREWMMFAFIGDNDEDGGDDDGGDYDDDEDNYDEDYEVYMGEEQFGDSDAEM
ncbi:hypothetical protein CEUSTIGMA_g6668.t1 [Chlamydomonas eustigma]|uniref:F-box domain-containing protein n=1 Tax=Chlamydomonas eustigma TaxID=1157962 RepID=A0A250X818_9CHLO|nr:hypothetical protein CEUSTIGMA_g6668.t1 [Chlamydomonas eustigma]|eukprot:GAX79228.1 hypothetical protein CEUSTIGMA_g6668.t1 [Chlamydomonas eustigma]